MLAFVDSRFMNFPITNYTETWLVQDNVVAEMVMHVTPDRGPDEKNPVSSSELDLIRITACSLHHFSFFTTVCHPEFLSRIKGF